MPYLNPCLRLGDTTALVDSGDIVVALWPDAASMAARALALGDLQAPVVRLVGGTLVGDLSLKDNLMLEPALNDGVLPSGLLPEIDALFAHLGCPIDWPGFARERPQQATPLSMLQVRVGRALAADADVLLIDAADWNDALIAPLHFSRSFAAQYPWRALAWATHDTARAQQLRESLKELLF